MFYIIFLFLFLLGGAELNGKLAVRNKICLFFIIVFIFFFLSFIRWERGTDWESYYDYFFRNDSREDFCASFERGYALLNYIVKTYVGEFTFLLFLIGGVIYLLKSYIIYKYSPYPLITLLFFWGYSFGDIYFVRQTLAIAILFFSFQYIVNRTFFKFFLCVIVAAFFHASSLIFLCAYWIYALRLKTYSFLLLLALGVIIGGFLGLGIVASVGQTLGGVFALKLIGYMEAGNTETFGLTDSPMRILFFGTVGKLFFILLALWGTKKIRLDNSVINGVVNIYGFGIILYAMLVPINVTLGRFGNSFDFFLVLLIPFTLFGLQIKTNKLIIFLLLICYSFKAFYSNLNGDYGKYYIPYKSIFNKEINVEIG